MKSLRSARNLVLIACGLIGLGETPATGQTPPAFDLDSLRQQQPDFLVRVAVDRISHQYRAGDQLTLSVVSEIDAYVYVLYEQADGQVFQVYPNQHQSQNQVKAKEVVQIPAQDDLFRWRIGPPFGTEKIKVIATDQPLQSLADPKLKAKQFNRVDEKDLKGVALELGTEQPRPLPKPPTHWAEADVEIVTAPASEALTNSKGRRYGIFFGVSEHQFAAFDEAASGRNPNLSTPHADAKVLNEIMKDVGRLQETKVFTNEQATRKNLEEAICKWLPKTSKPGDTIVIYFSGHGGQWEDDYDDEQDDLDEYLVPYDYMGPNAVYGMEKLNAAGQLPAEYQPVLSSVKKLIEQVGPDSASDLLIRETGVTDDLFGHWLQKLDGRDVVVILDICHAGGFATLEKSLGPDKKPKAFDFLDQELVRLKDIGQANTALLSASATAENSLVRQENDLSVMTYYLAEGLFGNPDSLTIQDAHQICIRGMERYFVEHPNAPPHHPQLYNQIAKPIFLKP